MAAQQPQIVIPQNAFEQPNARSSVSEALRALRFKNPFLPIMGQPLRTDNLTVNNAANYMYTLPFECAYFIVANSSGNAFMWGIGPMEATSGVAGTVTKGGYCLSPGGISYPIFGMGVSSIDVRGLAAASSVATFMLFGE